MKRDNEIAFVTSLHLLFFSVLKVQTAEAERASDFKAIKRAGKHNPNKAVKSQRITPCYFLHLWDITWPCKYSWLTCIFAFTSPLLCWCVLQAVDVFGKLKWLSWSVINFLYDKNIGRCRARAVFQNCKHWGTAADTAATYCTLTPASGGTGNIPLLSNYIWDWSLL